MRDQRLLGRVGSARSSLAGEQRYPLSRRMTTGSVSDARRRPRMSDSFKLRPREEEDDEEKEKDDDDDDEEEEDEEDGEEGACLLSWCDLCHSCLYCRSASSSSSSSTCRRPSASRNPLCTYPDFKATTGMCEHCQHSCEYFVHEYI